MALHAVNVSVGANLGDGKYSITPKNSSLPVVGTTTATTDNAATLTAINAMGALTGYSALTGAAAALAAAQAAKATVDTDIAALSLSIGADVSVIWDGTTITHRQQLRAALEHALFLVKSGYGGLAE